MSAWSFSLLEDRHVSRYISIVGESLHYYDPDIWQTYIARVGKENFRLALHKGECVGGLAFYRMGQWYGGRRVGSAGVSGVGMDPAHRGSGACKKLLQETLRELHEEKMPLASLYASTRGLYRSVGFEISGHQIQYQLKMPSFRPERSTRELEISRWVEPDFDILAPLAEQRGLATNGNIERTPGLWERIVEPIGRTTTTYILGDLESPEGYATLIHGKREMGHPQMLVASDWVALTPRALQRLMLLVLDHRSMCDVFQWSGAPQDPLLLAASEEHLHIGNQLLTLNRIIHLQAALEQRGYPPGIDAELHLEIEDELLPENAGRWILKLEDSRALMQPGGKGTLRCGIQDLVPVYTSMYTASQLAASGRVVCKDVESLRLADLLFSGPAPWTVELF